MEIIRKQLQNASAVSGRRYDEATDTVQTFDGTSWLDTPENDPRVLNQFPPLTSGAPRCDAAARITAATQDALVLTLDTLGTAVSATEVVGLIGIVFAFFAPYLALLYRLWALLAGAVFSIGYTALNTAFTGFDWSAFECKLYNLMQANGRLKPGDFNQFMNWIDATYDVTQRAFFHFVYDGLGYGGLNGAAATRAESGSCSSCLLTNFLNFKEQSYEAAYVRFSLLGQDVSGVPTWVPGTGIQGVSGLSFIVPSYPQLEEVLNLRICASHGGGLATAYYWVRNLPTHSTVRSGVYSNQVAGNWFKDIALNPAFTTQEVEILLGIMPSTGTPITNPTMRSIQWFWDNATPANPALACP
jgi:hypothetical protein